MSRSDQGAERLADAGAAVHRGSLEDPASLRRGAELADAVIHTAFDHDFSRFVENCEKDKRAIAALGAALAGSDRPLVITSGTAMGATGHASLANEDAFNGHAHHPRVASELAGEVLLEQGIHVVVVRLPQVHDERRQGLVSPLISMAREKGVSAYVGDGSNRWAAGHLSDVVRLYRLAMERGVRGARYHAVGEQGVSSRHIAEALGQSLGLPVKSITPEAAPAHFGWMSMFAAADMSASSELTQQRLGWEPTGRSLLADLQASSSAEIFR